jgi:hypothetical protein
MDELTEVGYDAHQPKRVEAGLTEKYLLLNHKPRAVAWHSSILESCDEPQQ